MRFSSAQRVGNPLIRCLRVNYSKKDRPYRHSSKRRLADIKVYYSMQYYLTFKMRMIISSTGRAAIVHQVEIAS